MRVARDAIGDLRSITGSINSRKGLLMTLAKKRLAFLAFALAVALTLQSTSTVDRAYACSCAGSSTPGEELESSDAVFVGKAVENGLQDPNPQDDAMFGGIRFDVSKAWKGVPKDSVVIYGQSRSYYGPLEEGEMFVESSCAVPFARGSTYLVYASRIGESDFLQANTCGRTGVLAGVEEDLEALGPATEQLPDTGGPALPMSDAMVFGTTVFLALVATLAGASAARRLGRDEES